MPPKAWVVVLALVSCGRATTSTTAAPDDAVPAAEAPMVEEANGERIVRVDGTRIDIEIEGDASSLDPREIHAWVRTAAEDVAAYYGRFPVPDLRIKVFARGRGSVGFGQHFGGRRIEVRVGSSADAKDFAEDWTMVHEMLHACFPDLDDRHDWMQEGLSTYLQRVVQARRGRHSEEALWSRWMEAMELGRPRRGDRGLDETRTWGRLYWGGALFWMVVDIEIRKATANQKSLRDALIGIVNEGGTARAHWSTAQVVEAGDRAVGTPVLARVYAAMAEAPGDVALDALWRELGVRRAADGRVEFDEAAPLAHIREAMTRD